MGLTIEQYLQPIPNVTMPATYVSRVLEQMGITAGVQASTVSQELRDLAEAEIWNAASQMASGGGYSKRVNNRQISENMPTISEATRKQWLETANSLRAKWGVAAFRISEGIYDASDLWGVAR